MKVLVVGPSDTRSQGGMATVIGAMRESPVLNGENRLDFHASFVDGSKAKRLAWSVYGYLRFLTIYRKYDLFHIHTASYGSTFRKMWYLNSAKKAGKKVVVHIHGAKYLEFYDGLPEKKKKQVVDFLKAADRVIALSDDWKEKFEALFGLQNCVAIPNGVDSDQFAQAITDPESTHASFCMMGRLGQRKGTYDLVEAARLAVEQNPNIRLYLAGDGDVEQVKGLLKEYDLEQNVSVVGWLDLPGKLDLLKKCATVVLPSYNEGLPMAILEGMAAKKAILSTTVGAIPEVIAPENGILVEPGDVQALANALVKLAGDVSLVAEMGQKNREKLEASFSMKQMHEKIATVYKEVMGA